MISQKLFEKIRKKHGKVASWAVWADEGESPTSNIGDLSIFNPKNNPDLLNLLRTDVIMVGLNFSRDVDKPGPFRNFHDSGPHSKDFKIRYAFKGTKFYGAYMTDVIKNFAMVDSVDVKKYLKSNPDFVKKNISLLKKELKDIESNRPIILAFGSDAHKLIKNNLTDKDYSKLICLRHYSCWESRENYRKKVKEQLRWV